MVENRGRRKQTENWKENVKWVVKGCGRRGRELIRWKDGKMNKVIPRIGRSFPDYVYAYIIF